MGFVKLIIALILFSVVCGNYGITISDPVSIIGIAILLGGFIAHKED